MPKDNNNFKKALEQFCLDNYKTSLDDAIHEKKIFTKSGDLLTKNKIDKASKDKKIIAYVNGEPKFIDYNEKTNKLEENEKKKNKGIQEMPDKEPLKWYKLLITAIYLLFKLIKKAITAVVTAISSAREKKVMEKVIRENSKYDRSKSLANQRVNNKELDNNLLKDDLIIDNNLLKDSNLNLENENNINNDLNDDKILDNNILNENFIDNKDTKEDNIIDNNILNEKNNLEDNLNINEVIIENKLKDNNITTDNIIDMTSNEFRKPIEVPELINEVNEEELINNVNLKLAKESDRIILDDKKEEIRP